MSAADMRQMIEMASAWAERQFARKGQIEQMWHAITSDGEKLFISPPSTDKDTANIIMRAVFELQDVVRCLFIDEAWLLVDDDISKLESWIEEHGGVRDHPDSIEVVMFIAEDESGGQMAARRVIERRARGKSRLGPLEIDDLTGVQSYGRTIGMLPRRGATVQ